MGGIGDYSGSLVLELPMAEAAFAAVQVVTVPGITVATLPGDVNDSKSQPRVKTITPLEWVFLRYRGYESARAYFAGDPRSAWAAYVAGSVLVLLRERQSGFDGGLRILIDSRVPEGKGVSSSAAVEVATMRAVAAAVGIDLSGEELARLCQLAENRVVGAPCGIMDQMTSAIGRENELLALRCQPATVEGFVPNPRRNCVLGHRFRCSPFGRRGRLFFCPLWCVYGLSNHRGGRGNSREAGQSTIRASSRSTIQLGTVIWRTSRLVNFILDSPARFQYKLSGREFLQRYAGTTDHVTRVDAERHVRRARTYAVSHRNESTGSAIANASRIADQRAIASRDGPTHVRRPRRLLGLWFGMSDATDLLVRLVREAAPTAGLYGAKITGGGSGGTVAILGRSDAGRAVATIASQYAEITGRETYVFRGSSPGAYSTPVQQIVI